MDPILQAAATGVSALPALTQPFGTTLSAEFAYFKCAQPNGATIRTDGKRISFHNGYHKTNIKEDIEFMRLCISKEPNGIFSEVSGEDIQTAEAVIDPEAFKKKKMQEAVLRDLVAAGIVKADDPRLASLMDGVSLAATDIDNAEAVSDKLIAQQKTDEQNAAAVLAANQQGGQIAGVDAAAAARAKLEALKGVKTGSNTGDVVVQPVVGSAVPLITPVSTSDLASAASGSNS